MSGEDQVRKYWGLDAVPRQDGGTIRAGGAPSLQDQFASVADASDASMAAMRPGPSYEGITLQSLAPTSFPAAPSPPPVPSYEGVSLQAPSVASGTPKISLVDQPRVPPGQTSSGAKSPPPGWTPLLGPPPEDDAAFANYIRQREAAAAAPVARPMAAGGGAPANPDPFGVKGAQKKLFGTFDTEKEALSRAAHEEGNKAYRVAELNAEQATRAREDASIDRLQQDDFNERYDRGMTELQTQMNEVRAKQLKPLSYIEASGGHELIGLIGAVAGGLYMGVTGSGVNPYLAHLDKIIDRQYAADEKNLDNQKESVRTQMNFLGHQRDVFKDKQLAQLQYRNAMYEAFKNEVAAEAAKYDSPIYTANADAANAQITRKQAELELAMDQRMQQQAAAAAGANAARAKEVRDLRNNIFDKMIGAGYSPDIAENEANRQVAAVYAPGLVGARQPGQGGQATSPLASVPKDLKSEAAKEWAAYSTAEKSIEAIGKQFQNWDKVNVTSPQQMGAVQATIAGAYKTALGPGMSSNEDFHAFIKPNIPAAGNSPETLALKRANIESFIRSKVATPILDSSSPGWRIPSREEKAAAIGAKPVR